MDKLIDRFNREINYLRVSVTDRCNMRCIYCMPPEGILHRPHSQILSFEEIYRIVNICSSLGIKKVRITGGEPLVRKNLPMLVRNIRGISGIQEIALTTNAIFLSEYAYLLKDAGLDRVNISLDSLVPERFNEITRGGDLNKVLEGMEAALSAGLRPLKINVVLMKGFNDSEIISFAGLAMSRPVHVRFIEYMPTYLGGYSYKDLFFSCKEANAVLSSLGGLEPVEDNHQLGTARVFRIRGFCGTIGFISPMSKNFCFSCNKLRLTSNGCLKSCLHSSISIDLKDAMENGASDNGLAALIRKAVDLKPISHNLNDAPIESYCEHFSMCQIGG